MTLNPDPLHVPEPDYPDTPHPSLRLPLIVIAGTLLAVTLVLLSGWRP